jgi:hypothetical protein
MAVACLPLSNNVSAGDLVDANAHGLEMQMLKVHEPICTDAGKTVAAWFLLTKAGSVQRLGALL